MVCHVFSLQALFSEMWGPEMGTSIVSISRIEAVIVHKCLFLNMLLSSNEVLAKDEKSGCPEVIAS